MNKKNRLRFRKRFIHHSSFITHNFTYFANLRSTVCKMPPLR
jgi:hypothetical protein